MVKLLPWFGTPNSSIKSKHLKLQTAFQVDRPISQSVELFVTCSSSIFDGTCIISSACNLSVVFDVGWRMIFIASRRLSCQSLVDLLGCFLFSETQIHYSESIPAGDEFITATSATTSTHSADSKRACVYAKNRFIFAKRCILAKRCYIKPAKC